MAFEILCRDILQRAFPDVFRVALKRTSGVTQFGVDVEGFDRLGYPEVVLSAKCYKRIRAWEFRLWIQDFIDDLDGHWKDKNVKHFILAVTVEANDDDMSEQARVLARELDKRGIQFHLWDSIHISKLLRDEPAVVSQHFHKYWTDALLVQAPQDNPTVEPTAPVSLKNLGGPLAAFAEQLSQTYVVPLNNSVASELENAIGALRQGRRAPVRKWLGTYRTDAAVWNALDEATRARGLRVVAVIDLAEGNASAASDLLDEADALQEAPDRSARLHFIRATQGVQAALQQLKEPASVREFEMAAGLLIEDDRPEEAFKVLSDLLGDKVTVEVLRLRAIAKVLSRGD